MSELVLAGVVTLTAGCTLVYLPPLHPAQFWAVPWACATVLFALDLLPFRSLGWDTVSVASLSTLGFVVCSIAGGRSHRVAGSRTSSRLSAYLPRAAIGAVIFTGAWLLAFIIQASESYGLADTLRSSLSVRGGIGRGDFFLTIKYIYMAFAAVSLSAIAASQATGAAKWRWIAVACASGATIYFATGRATLVTAAIAGLATYHVSSSGPRSRRRFLFAIGGVLIASLAVFLGGGALIGKTFENNPDLQRTESIFAERQSLRSLALPYQYATAPIAALDVQVGHADFVGDGLGCASLPEACSALDALGLDVKAVPRVRKFTAPPLIWNTYTALDAPLLDWGILFVIPVMSLLGYLVGRAWAYARADAVVGRVAYGLLAAAVSASAGSFAFTAPHLLGGFTFALILLEVARLSGRFRPVATPEFNV